jgi:hypothetical protein
MKERASGADRWRLCNEAEWKRQELAESGNLPSGSLRLCQRRQPEQQRSQSAAANAMNRRIWCFGLPSWETVRKSQYQCCNENGKYVQEFNEFGDD